MSIKEIDLPTRKTHPEFPPGRKTITRQRESIKLRNLRKIALGRSTPNERRPTTLAKWVKLVDGNDRQGPPNLPTAVGGELPEEGYDVVAEATKIVINSGFSIETHKN